MKRYFFLGFGTGLIFAGILVWVFRSDVDLKEVKTKTSEVKVETEKARTRLGASYYVQIGAYKYYENSEKIVKKFDPKNLKVVKMDNMYKVVSNNFDSYDEAEKFAKVLEEKFEIKVYIKEIITGK